MRILQICSAGSIGGGERHVADLSNELAKRGHDVFCAIRPGSPVSQELRELEAGNIVSAPLRNAVDIPSAVQIAKFAAERNVELVNAHLARDYPVAAFVARRNKIPLIVTRHVLFPMSRLHRLLLRRVKFVIAPSNAVAANLRRERIFPSEKIVTIRYGIDLDRFPVSSRDNNLLFRVGSIGNLDPVKGFDLLIQAAGIVNAENPAVKFEIVGDDRSEDGRTRRELEELIVGLGLSENIRLSGWSDEIGRKLAGFDLFVSSSRSESFGFVIAEAMLSGVPVIATATEGAKEIISELPLGVIVPIGSAQALADAILDLLNDEPKRRQLAKFGRRHIQENFGLERMVNETEELYRSVVESNNEAPV